MIIRTKRLPIAPDPIEVLDRSNRALPRSLAPEFQPNIQQIIGKLVEAAVSGAGYQSLKSKATVARACMQSIQQSPSSVPSFLFFFSPSILSLKATVGNGVTSKQHTVVYITIASSIDDQIP